MLVEATTEATLEEGEVAEVEAGDFLADEPVRLTLMICLLLL